MDKIVNLINLTGWVFLLVDLQLQFVFSLKDFLVSDITFLVYILRSVQLFQIFDMVLILLKKSKGNLIASFFQILGRLLVCCVFVQPQTHRLKFAGLVVCWSIADINRYLYYLYKDSSITSFLRYNSFLLLYPLGVICQMLVINDFIERHPDLQQEYVIVIRVIQVSIIGGMLFLYNYMLGGRKKWAQQKLEDQKKKKQSQSTKSE